MSRPLSTYALASLLLTATAAAGPIKGRVLMASAPPDEAALAIDSPGLEEVSPCQAKPADTRPPQERTRVEGAVVFLEVAPPEQTPLPPSATLTMTECGPEPRVQTLRQGQTLKVVNGSPEPCQLEAVLDGEQTVLQATLQLQNQSVSRRIKEPGRIEVRCLGRPLSTAWLHVFPHSFSVVTATDGSFTLPAVPPGRYTIVAWHDRFGTTRLPLVVTSAPLDLNLNLGP